MMYLRLFWEFFKIGLFAVGGGMATVPFLQTLGERTLWFTTEELANMIAVSESTPGPIGVNMATYVGYTTAGVPGGIIATLGLIAPSIIIILIVAAVLEQFRESRYVKAAFYGLRPASAGLIAAAALAIILIAFFGVDTVFDVSVSAIRIRHVILAAVLFVLIRYVPKVKELHPICFILFAAVAGIIFAF